MQIMAGQGSGIRSVGSSILHVRDLELMKVWYGDILGISLVAKDQEQPFYVFDMENGVNLMLDDHRFMQDQENHPIFMLTTLDIGQSYAWVKGNGIPVVLDLQQPHPGLAYFNILDSEGNALMIVYSTWVNPSPVHPISTNIPIKNFIQSVVVPVTDLKRATERYGRILGHSIKPERQNGGPIYWFDMDNGTGILLDDNRDHKGMGRFPTFMLKASNIYEAYQYLQSKNGRIVLEIEHDHHFFAEDPEGNTMIICL